MDDFVSSGLAVDVVVVVLLLEALWLRWRGNDWALVAGIVLPAVLMMLALRAGVTGMAWPWICLPLAAAFPIHLYDLHRRGAGRPARPR